MFRLRPSEYKAWLKKNVEAPGTARQRRPRKENRRTGNKSQIVF